jgi:hypothetical protein
MTNALKLADPPRPTVTIRESATVSPTTSDKPDAPKPNDLQGKWKKRGAPYKNPEDMINVLATGRARASEVKPINDGDICEWSGLRYAGGSVIPIIGCNNSVAQSVHHGPNKSVLDNRLENLHKLCATCHERFHICNDSYYGSDRPANGESWLPVSDYQLVPHNSTTLATSEAVIYYNFLWKKIRSASRHSRHDEAEGWRDVLITFAMEGLENELITST